MSKKQREKRDESVARDAVDMAVNTGKKVGIGVDDDIRVEKMVERVKRIASGQGLDFEIDKKSAGTYMKFSKGTIYVFAADKLGGKPGN